MSGYRRGLLAAAAALGLAAAAFAPALAGSDSAAKKHGPIAWNESLQRAEQVSAQSRKPVMVDFWAEWCGPCKAMLATTYKDKAVVQRSKQFVPVLVNLDQHMDLAKKYSIEAIPTVLFLDAKGNVLARSTGYLGRDDFLKLMDAAAHKAK